MRDIGRFRAPFPGSCAHARAKSASSIRLVRADRRGCLDVTQAEIIADLLAFLARENASEAEFERMALTVFGVWLARK